MNVTPRQVLIVKPSSLGDVVHSLPFLNAMKGCFPTAEIDWVIARGLEGLLEGHPMIRRLIIIDKDAWKDLSRIGLTIRELVRLSRDLRQARYDVVVDLQGLFRSGVITAMSGAGFSIGFAEAREGSRWMYKRRIRGGRDVHAVERYLKIAAALGCDAREIAFPFPQAADTERIAAIKRTLGKYAVLVPSARWKTKIWPAEHFGSVASRLPFRSVVIGGRGDMALAESVVRHSEGKAVSCAGETTLQELIGLMRDARLVISNDSGPMHIAAGLGVPVVAIFGPTSPVRTGPYGSGHIIVRSPADCAPCYKKECPTSDCMAMITPDEVCEKIAPLLATLDD